jgi:hypothetical protein
MLATSAATALNVQGDYITPVRWDDWLKLPVREHDTGAEIFVFCDGLKISVWMKLAEIPFVWLKVGHFRRAFRILPFGPRS